MTLRKAFNLLFFLLLVFLLLLSSPVKPGQTFSTLSNSSSTGVARPKMVTVTRTRDFS